MLAALMSDDGCRASTTDQGKVERHTLWCTSDDGKHRGIMFDVEQKACRPRINRPILGESTIPIPKGSPP